MKSQLRNRLTALVAGLGLTCTAQAGPDKAPKDAPAKPTGHVKVEPKPVVVPAKPAPIVQTPAVLLKFEPKPLPVFKPEVRLPEQRPVVVHERPKVGPAQVPATVGIKVAQGVKFDAQELHRIKPPIDLSKTKPEVVLGSKPPRDFQVKPIALTDLHIPRDATHVERLTLATASTNQAFVLNRNHYTAGDYHTRFGTRSTFGYAYAGRHHSHWHHRIWDPSFRCHYYFCPSAQSYYYWCEADLCYYPCHWFVDYGRIHYPWWIVGGFGGYGYVGTPHLSVFVGW